MELKYSVMYKSNRYDPAGECGNTVHCGGYVETIGLAIETIKAIRRLNADEKPRDFCIVNRNTNEIVCKEA